MTAWKPSTPPPGRCGSLRWGTAGISRLQCAAFGRFDPETEVQFLGIRDGRYIGGRLGNYTDEPEALAGRVGTELDRMKQVIDARPGAEPFALIGALMKKPM